MKGSKCKLGESSWEATSVTQEYSLLVTNVVAGSEGRSGLTLNIFSALIQSNLLMNCVLGMREDKAVRNGWFYVST